MIVRRVDWTLDWQLNKAERITREDFIALAHKLRKEFSAAINEECGLSFDTLINLPDGDVVDNKDLNENEIDQNLWTTYRMVHARIDVKSGLAKHASMFFYGNEPNAVNFYLGPITPKTKRLKQRLK